MADLLSVRDNDFVSIDATTNEILEIDGDKVSIVEQDPQFLEARSTSIELVIVNDSQPIVYTSDPLAYVSDVAVGGAGLDIYDEGGLVAKGVTELNFVGQMVAAKDQKFGRVSVFIPEPSYMSHFNTADGINNCVIPDVTVYNRIASIPTTEGTPFKIGNWASDQIHQVTPSGTLVYQTPAPCSFYDTSTTLLVIILSEDGTTPISQFTTPALAGNGVFISSDNAITITISGWGPDVDKYQAQVTIVLNLAVLMPNGGRFGASVTHTNSTDGVYIKVQNHLFYDANTHSADINNATIAQKWANSFHYLSGVRYYYLNDTFAIGIFGLSYINSNSYPQPFVASNCSDYGIQDFTLNSTDLTDWTPQWDNQLAYYEGDHNITQANIRFIGDAHISAAVLDWGIAKSVNSPLSKVIIDTFPQSSTELIENFDDEYYRQKEDFNSGFPYGNWLSDVSLAVGEAMVFGGQLIAPSEAHTIDHNPPQTISTWFDYLPFKDNGDPNPDYSNLTCPVNYYRTFLAPDPNRDEMNWQIYVNGTFVNGNVNGDITAGLIEIYLRRVASNMTDNIGPTATPMTVHGLEYSYNTFDDGVTDGGIRLGNSKDDMLGCTSGGLATHVGIHFHIRIFDPAIKIDTIRFEFN